MPRYKPYEEQQLESLIPALNQGMDPTTAYSIFSGLQGGAVERAMQQKAQRQAALQQAIGQMQSSAASGANMQGLESLMGSYQSAFPGLNRPKLDARLEGTLESLIPAGQGRSPLFTGMPQAPGEPGAEGTGNKLTREDLSNIALSAQGAATGGGDPAAVVPLHDARMQYMTLLRSQGYPESELAEAYDLFGQMYVSAGGNPMGTPITGYGMGEGTTGVMPGGGGGGGPSRVPAPDGGGFLSGLGIGPIPISKPTAEMVGRLGGGITQGVKSALPSGGGGLMDIVRSLMGFL